MRRVLLVVVSVIAVGLWAGSAQAQKGLFKDCGDCPEMMPIAPGGFTMGVPPGDEERENVLETHRHRSEPQHRVSIKKGFALARYTVTRGEFAAFVRETGYQTGDKCFFSASARSATYWKTGRSLTSTGVIRDSSRPSAILWSA